MLRHDRAYAFTYKFVQRVIVYTVSIGVLLISLFTFLLLLAPGTMSRIFWLNGSDEQSKNFAARIFQPFADRALRVVDVVKPDVREKVQPLSSLTSAQSLTRDEIADITTNTLFNLPSSSSLKIPDSNLVINLNSEYVQGQEPGQADGNLAQLPITSQHVLDGSLQGTDIAAGTVGLSNLSQQVIDLINSGQQPTFNGINGIQAGSGLAGGGTTGTPTISLQAGLSIQVVSGDVDLPRHLGKRYHVY